MKTNLKQNVPHDSVFCLTENRILTDRVHLLRFTGDTSSIKAPGQFVSVELPGMFLRRPFSVCDWDSESFSVIIDRVGEGTALLHGLSCGVELPVLTGLGNGFQLESGAAAPVLVGGGTGLSPLVGLARRLRESGVYPRILLGFREAHDRFGADLFDGFDTQYASDLFEELEKMPHDYIYACGSEAMMMELLRRDGSDAQVAFDVRMGCGFGACMGCARKTRDGMKRVCKDGPVFRKEELLWEN